MAKDAGRDLARMDADAPAMSMKAGASTDVSNANFAAKMAAKFEALAKRDAELKAVPILPVDVDTLVKELEITKTLAERTLREAGGDVREAARRLVFGPA